ncbi:MAG: ATP-grasp fold amidoligase family protein [Dongiaceae bacterium]
MPRGIRSSRANVNDFVFGRMIRDRWNLLQQACVDKEYAKLFVSGASKEVRVAQTLAIFDIEPDTTVEDLALWLAPFHGMRVVAKATHSSNCILFLHRPLEMAQLEAFLYRAKKNFFHRMRETQYEKLERKIILEEYLGDERGVNDYKFFCSYGQVFYCQVDIDRFINHRSGLFSLPEFQPVAGKSASGPLADLPKPERFDQMMRIAADLSQFFDFVRVDLYDGADGIYFGEYTFTPAAGCVRSFDGKIGVDLLNRILSTRSPVRLSSRLPDMQGPAPIGRRRRRHRSQPAFRPAFLTATDQKPLLDAGQAVEQSITLIADGPIL